MKLLSFVLIYWKYIQLLIIIIIFLLFILISKSDLYNNYMDNKWINKMEFPGVIYTNNSNLHCYETDYGNNISQYGTLFIYNSNHEVRRMLYDTCANNPNSITIELNKTVKRPRTPIEAVSDLSDKGKYVIEHICTKNTTPLIKSKADSTLDVAITSNSLFDYIRIPCPNGTTCDNGACKYPYQLEEKLENKSSFYKCDDVMRVYYNKTKSFRVDDDDKWYKIFVKPDGKGSVIIYAAEDKKELHQLELRINKLNSLIQSLKLIRIDKEYADLAFKNCIDDGPTVYWTNKTAVYTELELNIFKISRYESVRSRQPGPSGNFN